MIFVAIILHKVPEGFTIASVMLASGQTRRTAVISATCAGAGDDRRRADYRAAAAMG